MSRGRPRVPGRFVWLDGRLLLHRIPLFECFALTALHCPLYASLVRHWPSRKKLWEDVVQRDADHVVVVQRDADVVVDVDGVREERCALPCPLLLTCFCSVDLLLYCVCRDVVRRHSLATIVTRN